MSPLVLSILGALLRHALGALGAYLVAHHWLSDAQAQDAQEHLTGWALAHLVMYGPLIVAVGWSVLSKYKARLLQIAAADLPAGASDAEIREKAQDPIVKALVTKTISVALVLGLTAGMLGTTSACAHPKPPTPVAQVADIATQLEQSANLLLHQAQTASVTTDALTGKPFITATQLAVVAEAVDKTGELGLTLKVGLDDYSTLKASGKDVTAQAAAITRLVGDLAAGFANVQHAIPAGTVATIDQTITTIAAILAEIRTGVALP